jgi:DedD protein
VAAAPASAAPAAVRPAAPVAEAPKKPVAAAPRPAASTVDAARARALLDGKPAEVAAAPAAARTEEAHDGGRFVVQVGAFADAAAARETRSKVEKLGLKSYTQVVETSSGSRIRVRAGPFSSRDEADKALAKARAAGMTGVVLTL